MSCLFSPLNFQLHLLFESFFNNINVIIVYLALSLNSSFSQFMKEMKNLNFWILGCISKLFPNSLKSLEIEIFEMLLSLYFVRLWGQLISATYAWERGSQYFPIGFYSLLVSIASSLYSSFLNSCWSIYLSLP